jgi:hypothetical protein
LQALIGIEKSQLTHRRLCESKSHASDSHRSGEAAIFQGALKCQHAAQLLLDQADVAAVSRQVYLALFYDAQLDLKAMP